MRVGDLANGALKMQGDTGRPPGGTSGLVRRRRRNRCGQN